MIHAKQRKAFAFNYLIFIIHEPLFSLNVKSLRNSPWNVNYYRKN